MQERSAVPRADRSGRSGPARDAAGTAALSPGGGRCCASTQHQQHAEGADEDTGQSRRPGRLAEHRPRPRGRRGRRQVEQGAGRRGTGPAHHQQVAAVATEGGEHHQPDDGDPEGGVARWDELPPAATARAPRRPRRTGRRGRRPATRAAATAAPGASRPRARSAPRPEAGRPRGPRRRRRGRRRPREPRRPPRAAARSAGAPRCARPGAARRRKPRAAAAEQPREPTSRRRPQQPPRRNAAQIGHLYEQSQARLTEERARSDPLPPHAHPAAQEYRGEQRAPGQDRRHRGGTGGQLGPDEPRFPGVGEDGMSPLVQHRSPVQKPGHEQCGSARPTPRREGRRGQERASSHPLPRFPEADTASGAR
jgi:hypothetical protein